MHPLLSRVLAPEDDAAGAVPAAVISYHFWSKQFSQDASVLGETVSVNGTAFTIVVLPRRDSLERRYKPTRPTCGCLSTQPQVSQQESLLTPQGPYWLDIMGSSNLTLPWSKPKPTSVPCCVVSSMKKAAAKSPPKGGARSRIASLL